MTILMLLMLAAQPAADKRPCIAWRDPDTGKTINASELRDREDKMRQRMLNDEANDRSVIETARTPATCVVRAGDPVKQEPETGGRAS